MTLAGIDVEIVPHNCQRYETAGDWQWTSDGRLEINVSNTGDEDSNFLLMIHEIIEAYLCHRNGIEEETVDRWDMSHPESSEPGDIPGCPYFTEHLKALGVESKIGRMLNIEWSEHEKRIDGLFEEKEDDKKDH